MEIGAIVVIILIVGFYLVPTLIAETRGAKHAGSIFAINLLFGWTILGWIAALIWACVEDQAPAGESRARRSWSPSDPFYK